jgi:hypothetical protein
MVVRKVTKPAEAKRTAGKPAFKTPSGRITTKSGRDLHLQQTRSGRLLTKSGKEYVDKPLSGTATAKTSISRLKNYGIYEMHGEMKANFPKAGVRCNSEITVVCDSKEDAKDNEKFYKALFKEQMNALKENLG